MKKLYKIFLYFSLFVSHFSFISAQNHESDSLLRILKTKKEDTNKAAILNSIAYSLYTSNPDSTIILAQQALALSEKIDWKTGETDGYNNIGIGYYMKGDYVKSLDYYLKALKMDEQIENKRGQAADFVNIGGIYYQKRDYTQTEDYINKALKINEQIGNKRGQANNLSNLGLVYQEHNIDTLALGCFFKALKIDQQLQNKEQQADDLGNIGSVYYDMMDYGNALNYCQKALDIDEGIGDKYGSQANLGSLGKISIKTKKFSEAEMYLKKAITIDSSIDDKDELRQKEELMSYLYDTTGRYKLAFDWYRKAMVLKDTLFNIDKDKALTRKELTYKFEHQADSTKAAQAQKDALTAADAKKQQVITWSVVAGLLLAMVFAGFVVRSLRITRKQKQVIEVKSKEVEEKNKDILDSIMYAKRLQDAILPPLSVIKKYLPESFLIYKPKDIVAGDFYWMERSGDNILIAACDCTGHGVPGAMVSVVCSNALNRALNEFKIKDTGKMLDKVRELVLETFQKSEGEVKDGMDCSFCSINTKTNEIEWSGAYNPLWYIQNGKLKEVTANKQPVGKHDKPEPFNTNNIKLNKGDSLYLFTDGYADQFGGPKGKKFKYKQLQQLIIENAQLTMEEQRILLEQTFENWKGTLEQVDDILVMGIRV